MFISVNILFSVKIIFAMNGFSITIKIEDFMTLDMVKILTIINKMNMLKLKNNGLVDEYIKSIIDKHQKEIKKPQAIESLEIIGDQEYEERDIKKLLNMLKKERNREYKNWLEIILIFYFCSKTDKLIDYLLIAHEWLSRSPKNYDPIALDKLWKYLNKSLPKSKCLTMRSLVYYASMDNPVEYQKFRIALYLRMRKNAFSYNKMLVNTITLKEDICIVELHDTYCQFIKNNHETKSIYLKISKKGITYMCKECLGEEMTIDMSSNMFTKIFETKCVTDKMLTITKTDDILLMNESKYITNKLAEKNKYISDQMINEMKNYDTIIAFSPTGTGKTTTISNIIEEMGNEVKILSIISRRTMAALHKKAFESMCMTSYLSEYFQIDKNRYIVSLEQLYKVSSDYDVLILDEVTSLILHLYSPTMKKSRLKSFVKVIDLMHRCKKIIACDAIITDMTLDFITTLRRDKKIIYYRNTYQNKLGVNLKIYNRVNNSIKKELELFCKPIEDQIKNNKSIMIMCDSKTIANNIYNYLLKFNKDKDYFRVYTKDSGSLDEIENCNEEWQSKCVIFSPKIIYGIDVLINYENIYAVYKGSTIDSFSMLQQISRARHVKNVSALFLLKHYKYAKNQFISYEKNKYIEEKELQKFLCDVNTKFGKENMDKIKENILYELESIVMTGQSEEMINEINENSLFGRTHLYASWYNKLFSYNKSQLFEQLCKEQGYTISKHVLEQDETETKFIRIHFQTINYFNVFIDYIFIKYEINICYYFLCSDSFVIICIKFIKLINNIRIKFNHPIF